MSRKRKSKRVTRLLHKRFTATDKRLEQHPDLTRLASERRSFLTFLALLGVVGNAVVLWWLRREDQQAAITNLILRYRLAFEEYKWRDAAHYARELRFIERRNPASAAKWANNCACALGRAGRYDEAELALASINELTLRALDHYQAAIIHGNIVWSQFHQPKRQAYAAEGAPFLIPFIANETSEVSSVQGWGQLWSRRHDDENAWFVPPWGLLARLAALQGRPDLALQLFDREIRSEGYRVPGACILAASAALQLDHLPEASGYLERMDLSKLPAPTISHMEPLKDLLLWAIEGAHVREGDRLGSDLFAHQAVSKLADYYAWAAHVDVSLLIGGKSLLSRKLAIEYGERFLTSYSGRSVHSDPIHVAMRMVKDDVEVLKRRGA